MTEKHPQDPEFSFKFDKDDFENKIRNMPKLRKDKLYVDSERIKRIRYMDMAHALYIDSEKYNTYQERFDKLFERYEELYIGSPGLFQAAINRNMYDGEVGKVVKAFQSANGDAQQIYKNLDAYNDACANEAIKKINEFKQSAELTTNEQNKINSIIEKHKQENK